MVPLIASLVLLQVPVQQPPRLRTLLKNGAIVMVERMPGAKSLSIQLFASSRAVPETPETHGQRHLLEHLVAKGKGHNLDRRLESKGMFLRPFTLRDAMWFEVLASPNQLQEGLDAIGEVLKPLDTTQEEIDREIQILDSELALQPDSTHLSTAAWQQAYGDAGLDPLGNLDVMRKATPESLRLLQRKHFYPENLVIVIAGPVDLDDATKRASQLIGARQGATRVADVPRPAGKPGRIETDGYGDARGAIVPGFQDMSTAAALAAALSVASDLTGSFVTYTPSVRSGMVLVGQTAANGGMGLQIDGLGEAELARRYGVGKVMAHEWVQRQLSSPTGVGYLRGLLLSQGLGYRPESLLENIDAMTFEQFKAGMGLLKKDRAVVAVGS